MSKSSVVWTEAQYQEYCRKQGVMIPKGATPCPPSSLEVGTYSDPGKPTTVKVAPKRTRKKTQAESEYELILRLAHPDSKVLYEAIKLRIADRCHYCPDFTVVSPEGKLSFVEVKGPHIWEDSKIKFKAAKEMYPWAKFEMHQKRVDGWKQIY